jgi:phosphoesterase RecJ-like protein
MDKAHKELKKYIEKAQNILVVSHRGPDMDAFCSMLLVKEFLNIYYPKKSVIAKAKRLPSFNIPRMHDITVVDSLNKGEEDLIIIVDAAEIDLVCEEGDGLIDTSTKIAVIDHHMTERDRHDVLINENRSSAAEQVIVSFKEILGKKFKLTKEIAELGQYGISADTGRFLYETTGPDTFRLYADLYEFSPIDLEEVTYKVNKFPRESIDVMVELLRRVIFEKDMVYTYIKLEDTRKWSDSDIGEAVTFFKNNFLRYIQGVHWGFVLKPSTKEENIWYANFRAAKGFQRVDRIAEDLGGGGHMYASGAKIVYSEPKTSQQVLTDVLTVIEKHTSN